MTDPSLTAAKELPRYPLLPAGLIGRLAVATAFARRGRGAALPLDATVRATRADPAIYALIVDAKNDDGRRFHEHMSFQPLTSRPASLYWPVTEALRRISPNT